MDKQSFTTKYLPAARMAGELYGLNPVVILAQAAIESGWGESRLATCYNNFFGLTGYGVSNAYWHGGKTDLDNPAAVSNYPRAYAREMAYSKYISEVNGDNREAYCNMLESIARSLVPIVYNLNNKAYE